MRTADDQISWKISKFPNPGAAAPQHNFPNPGAAAPQHVSQPVGRGSPTHQHFNPQVEYAGSTRPFPFWEGRGAEDAIAQISIKNFMISIFSVQKWGPVYVQFSM